MTKKKKKDNDLFEFLGMNAPSKKELIKINLQGAKNNAKDFAPKESSRQTIAPVRRTTININQTPASKILSGDSPFTMENIQKTQKERERQYLQEKDNKNKSSITMKQVGNFFLNTLSSDPTYGTAINFFRRATNKAKTGEKLAPSDIILGGNVLSSSVDRIRETNESKLNNTKDTETTILLKQKQKDLNKQLITARNTKSKNYDSILKEYNQVTDQLQTEQAKNLKKENGIIGAIDKGLNTFTGGLDSSVKGMDSAVDKLLGGKPQQRLGATEVLSNKALQDTKGKVGKLALETSHSLGAMVPTIIGGLASGGVSTAVSFGTYGGSAYNQAKRDGYTDEQATRYGAVNGGLEAMLNKILPSFKFGGKNVYGKTATDKFTKKIMTKTIGNEAFKRLVTDASGEFTEEYLQEFLDPIVRETLLEEDNGVGIIKGKKADEIAKNIASYTANNFFSKENLHAGAMGALTSGIMGTHSAIKSNAYTKATGRSSETGLTQNEQQVMDNIIENRKSELIEKNGKVTKKEVSQIEKNVKQDLERGYLDVNDIERALSNDEWSKHNEVVKQKESIEKQIKELESKTPQDYKTIGELNSSNEKLSSLKEQLASIDLDTTRNELNYAMDGKITDKDTLLNNVYNQEAEKNNAYQFDESEEQTENIKKINEDIKKLNLNNHIKTRDTIDLLKKISNDTGRQYRLVDNKSEQMQKEYDRIVDKISKQDNISIEDARKKTENLLIDGFVSNGEIFINVDSENLINRITGHETTHLFEGTEEYSALQSIARKFAETKGEYETRKQALQERYRGVEDADIENELTSDLVGDYLFSDINFVRNLSTEQPNIFKRIYNHVKHLYNMATAGSKEARQLEQLKYNFEKVYRENNQSKASNNTKLMASRIEESIENNAKIEYNKDGNLNKYKSGTLFTQMMSRSESGVEENVIVNDAKNTYVVSKNADNEYDIKLRIDNLEYNKHKKYYKEVLDYVKGRKEAFNNAVSNENEFRPDNSNNDNVKRQETWIEFADTILEQYERDGNTTNNEESNGNNGELKSSFSSKTKYSISVKEADTGKDNNGVKLSKTQKEYFKDSKATDEEGNLITVYHTTTNEIPQFNEFNPVGTPYYRFGDQVVNYYTDSKDMSGSYASQDYKMADTKKLNNIEDAKKYMEHISKLTGNVFDITQRGDNKFYATQDKQISKEARNFIEKLSETEKQQMLDNIYEDEKMKEFDPNYSRVFSWNYFDKPLQEKYNKLTEKYLGTADAVAIQQEVMKYLESPVLLHEDTRFNGEIIGVYDTEEEMLKNIKTDMQKSDWSKNSKIQYEGYVNITNPYVIDAEERNWNQVVQQSNDFIDELEERVPQDVKDNLTRLYQESANKSAEARENYEVVEQVIRQGIDGYQSAVDEEIQKANQVVKKVGFNEIEQILNDTQNIGVNPWYNIAEALQDEGVIGSATKTFIIDEFKLPKQVKEWLQENYNKGIPLHQIPTNNPLKLMKQLDGNTTPSLKDIYNKNAQNYEEFDKYRMPNSYFMEQISSEDNDHLGNELNDIFETRAEIYSPEQVGEEIAQASSVSFSKPEMIRLWGTSKTTNDVVKEIIASNKDGKTNYDGVIIRNVYDYGGKSATGTQANDLYITFNSNQFKALDNTKPTEDADIRYKLSDKRAIAPIKKNPNEVFGKEMRVQQDKAVKKAIAPIEKAKQNPKEYKPYLEMSKEINKDETSSEVTELLNKVDSENTNVENVKPKPRKQGMIADAKRTAQYLFTNRNAEIDEYARETGNKNIKILADHVNNIQGEITTNINNAQLDNFGNVIGKGITQIFDQARQENKSDSFNDYLFHKSNMARHKQGKGSLVDYNESEQLVKEYEKDNPEFKEWAREVNEYNTNLLYKQAEAGLITEDLADSLTKMYDFYVPFFEDVEKEYSPNESRKVETRSTIKSARGGADKNLLGFEEAMMRQTQSAITQIRKNQLYNEIIKTKANRSMDFENNTNPDVEGTLQESGGKYYLTGYENGKATQVEIDKNLYHGLNQHGDKLIKQYEKKFKVATKPLQVASNIRRNILTSWSPTFIITNPLKDLQDAPLNSKYAKDWAKNVPRAFKELTTGKGTELDVFLNMYGQANLRGDYNIDSGLADITKLAKANKKASKNTDSISKKMLKKIPQMNEIIEMAPRYAEYLASIENGASQMEALYNAREVTTNFGRGGIITKALNRNGFTFLNASVQGFSKLVRNFSGENGGKAVLGCIAKASAFGLAPALINAILLGDDDDYEAIPDYIKDNYYLIKTSDDNFLRIPKGRMMSIFGSAGRRVLERTNGKRPELSLKEDVKGYLSNAYNQVGVQNPSESNIFAPIIQAKNNKTWYGTDLVPKRLQTDKDGREIPKSEQYDASTDKFSIWLGSKLGVSPYKINYVVDQYSGGIGDMILPTITEEAQSKSDSVIGKAIAPLKDKFTADSVTDNKNVTNFYSKVEELGKMPSKNLSKKDEMSYQYMRNLSFEMGSLYKEMREVQSNTKMEDSKKYAKVQNIKAEINKIAEEGMKGYKDVEAYENYARVGDRELYKYKNKKGETGWSLSDSKYADDINTLGLSVKEKNTYYTTKMKMSDVANQYGENDGSKRYRAVIKTIRKSDLPSDAKYELFNSWYGKNDNSSSVAQDVGISADDYLKYKTADLSADKNKNGYSIRGSKANKVINFLNKKTNLNKGQKAILYRMSFGYKGNYYSTNYSNKYNSTIVKYVNTLDTTYDEDVNIYKTLGFKVDKKGNIWW